MGGSAMQTGYPRRVCQEARIGITGERHLAGPYRLSAVKQSSCVRGYLGTVEGHTAIRRPCTCPILLAELVGEMAGPVSE